MSADGRTAAAGAGPRWISSEESRALVHEMRAQSGAVMVGSGTALADDPLLTARDCHPPAERQPLRVVLDRRGRLPATSRLARTASSEAPVLVVRAPGAGGISAADVEAIECDGPAAALRELGRRRIAWALLEGGATVATALLDAGLDRPGGRLRGAGRAWAAARASSRARSSSPGWRRSAGSARIC